MGKKKRNKVTGAVEYEIYKDRADLRKHYRARHFACRKPGCEDLAFTDQAQMAHHYAAIHGERIQINLAFRHESSDDEADELPDDYYQRKEYKRKLLK